MKDQLERIEYLKNKITAVPDLMDKIDSDCDIIFKDDDVLRDDLECLLEGGCRQTYDILPFAGDGTGAIYALIDRKHIAYISTEGQAGYIAETAEDFFCIMLNCRMGLFDFMQFEEYELDAFKRICEGARAGEPDIIDKFLSAEGLDTDIANIHKRALRGMTIEPAFVITPTSEDYCDSEPLADISKAKAALMTEI